MIHEAREATDRVADTADAVVDETATQQDAVEVLEARVDELSE
jgi:hypothetical protein